MSSIVFQHHANGTDYVYMSSSYWDADKKAPRTRMICIGKKDPHTGEIIYNKRWKELQAEEDKNLNTETPPVVSSTLSVGPSILLEAVTKRLGMKRSLLKGFDADTTSQLLALAWFFASSPAQRAYLAEGWMESHRCPHQGSPLTSPRITELLQSITRDQILSFFKSWLRRSTEKEYLCLDITNADTGKMPMLHLNISISPCIC